MKLTSKRVLRALKTPGRYSDGGNLHLQVSAPGAASWIFRYERDGVERMLGLGSLDTFTLGEARERAKATRQLLADGVDPIEFKRSQRAARALATAKAMTFRQAAQSYYEQHERKWKNRKHAAQFLSTLKTYA